jgi:predicted ATPase
VALLAFLSALAAQRDQLGFYVLDEPESGLSFSSCLSLLAMLAELVADGSQVLLATHSPVLAALPDATIVELTDDGMSETEWDQLDLVAHARKFLNDRDAYLRYLLD